MPRGGTSAGCVVVRRGDDGWQVLLVHPRGATFRRPLFGIPKGALEEGEDARAAAVRETFEETGLRVEVRGELGSIRQKSGKVVHAFWAEVDPASEAAIDERGRCRVTDGENDVCRFYPLDMARPLMIERQRELIDRLDAVLAG